MRTLIQQQSTHSKSSNMALVSRATLSNPARTSQGDSLIKCRIRSSCLLHAPPSALYSLCDSEIILLHIVARGLILLCAGLKDLAIAPHIFLKPLFVGWGVSASDHVLFYIYVIYIPQNSDLHHISPTFELGKVELIVWLLK